MTLEIGMKLYLIGDYGRVCSPLIIGRVTKSRAYAEDLTGIQKIEREFDREQRDDAYIHRRGDKGSRFRGRDAYVLETPELKAKYERRMKEVRFSRIQVEKLTDEQLDKIIQVIEV